MSSGWIHDLNTDAPSAPVVTDVCILGAGPVGLTLTCALAQLGLSVTVLELGGSTSCPADTSDVHFDSRPYRGATIGRAMGLGGTSVLWGGQLLPIRAADLLARPQIGAPAWPIAYAQIEPYFAPLQKLLRVRGDGFDLPSTRGSASALTSLDFTDWEPRASKWLSFRRRNVAMALNGHLSRHSGIQVWLNARVDGWELGGTNNERSVRELHARSAHGETLRVQPRAVVIAGGALEAARSVLDLNAAAGSLSAGVSALAGRFLHDHLSLRIARVRVVDEAQFQCRFAPFFEGSTMRSLRMELPPNTLANENLPALYAHFIAEPQPGSGFAVVRDCLRAVQRRDVGLILESARRVPRALPEIAKIAHARFAKRRLAFPAHSEFYLHVDLEQAPRYENRVYLGNAAGRERAALHIDWNVKENAPRIAGAVQKQFERFWSRNTLGQVATLEFLDLSNASQAWNGNIYDLYHPAGTTRMAEDRDAGVVDQNLRIHGTGNAFVAGCSVFPSLGAANPTFTAMALGLRLANFIAGMESA
ncbi:MAG TPA: GMC oxidoreductase [Steroidobacteraceae bacterium]